jgi:hypothetical protein
MAFFEEVLSDMRTTITGLLPPLAYRRPSWPEGTKVIYVPAAPPPNKDGTPKPHPRGYPSSVPFDDAPYLALLDGENRMISYYSPSPHDLIMYDWERATL